MRRRRNQYKVNRRRRQQNDFVGLSFGRKKKEINIEKFQAGMLWTGEILFVIAVAAMLVFFFGIRVTAVGQSMSGTLENGETVLVNRFVYKLFEPKENDIIVFKPNGNEKSHYYIKRVIAVPGDTVQIIDGKVYVNDELFEETIEVSYIEDGLLAKEPVKVGEDEYFVLGDNRNNSEDSRYANIGNVKKEHIYGKAWFVVSPLNKLGFLN